ncbi:hypothetical protein [Bacillus sp. KH172YL63]|uniref:hypothetical protein n=1 Tax=Bacillus sp. KH172YL63 TaxID=2709784 RepID=UPI0013E4FA19|nr:hypothetical protein [Bacillus sp. KH172YL63]BCB04025.1 hypothetical protein KH172YL63_21580 [Bacillus sp. KH172YL63]
MNHTVAGFLLLGFTMLTAVVVYAIGELSDSIKASAGYLGAVMSEQGGADLGWGGNLISSNIAVILLLLPVSIALYLIFYKKD